MDYKEQAHKLELRFKYDRMGLLQLGSDLCKDCSDAGKSIIELLARAEEAEERCKELEDRCKRLNEDRERANEAAAKWEGAYKLALERAEMAETEIERLKNIMRNEGIVVIPSKYPGCKSEWNMPLRWRKEE